MKLGFLLLFLLAGCASMENIDRSLTASPLLSFTEENGEAPHTALRGGDSKGGSGCSVCAH